MHLAHDVEHAVDMKTGAVLAVTVQATVYANRWCIRGVRGKRLLRQRGLMLKRPFAHALETVALR